MDHLAFFENVAEARTPSAVVQLLATHTRDLGQTSFAIGGSAGSALEDITHFFFTNWNPACFEEYEARGLVHHDPAPSLAATRITPLVWNDVWSGRAGVPIGEGQLAVKDNAEDYGYFGGLYIPIQGPNGYQAVASFIGPEDPPTARHRGLLHMLGLYAHHRLLELHNAKGSTAEPDISLTPREQDALCYVIAGETDEGIARRMGVAERTVRFHLNNVRQKLSARTRAQAVAKAIILGLVRP